MSKNPNPPISLPKLFTIDQVAAFIQFSTRQVRRWIASGDLRAKKIGRHWRIGESDLALFLAVFKPT